MTLYKLHVPTSPDYIIQSKFIFPSQFHTYRLTMSKFLSINDQWDQGCTFTIPCKIYDKLTIFEGGGNLEVIFWVNKTLIYTSIL